MQYIKHYERYYQTSKFFILFFIKRQCGMHTFREQCNRVTHCTLETYRIFPFLNNKVYIHVHHDHKFVHYAISGSRHTGFMSKVGHCLTKLAIPFCCFSDTFMRMQYSILINKIINEYSFFIGRLHQYVFCGYDSDCGTLSSQLIKSIS